MHGLGSNPDTAWLGSRSRANWLADFLPTTHKDFRIIAVNHDSRWDAYSPVQSLGDYGQVILDSIAALRLDEEVWMILLITQESSQLAYLGEQSATDTHRPFFWGYPHQESPSNRKRFGHTTLRRVQTYIIFNNA